MPKHLGNRIPPASLGQLVLEFHEGLARLGLEHVAEHGFVLAGGYAISVNGIGAGDRTLAPDGWQDGTVIAGNRGR